jgi:hypothetical protein
MRGDARIGCSARDPTTRTTAAEKIVDRRKAVLALPGSAVRAGSTRQPGVVRFHLQGVRPLSTE